MKNLNLKLVAALGIASLAGMPVLGGSASATARMHRAPRHHAKRSTGSVKPDVKYFRGKTLTFVSPGAPGGTYDALARLLAPQIANYLHCSVNVQDNPAGGSIAGQNQVANAAPNGLTLGELNPSGDVEAFVTRTAGVSFSLLKQNYIAAVPAPDTIWASSLTSGINSYKQLLKPPAGMKILDPSSGYQDLQDRVFIGAYGIPTSTLISGYNGAPWLLSGFIRGDGPVVEVSLNVIEPYLAQGRAHPLLLALPLKPGQLGYALLHKLKLPTYASLNKTDTPKTRRGRAAYQELMNVTGGANQIVFTPEGTPARLNAALTEAIHAALTTKSIIAEEDTLGLAPGFIGPKAVRQGLNKEIRQSAAMTPFLPAG